MKTILDILNFSLSGGFWHFIGCYLLLGIPFRLLEKLLIKPVAKGILSMKEYLRHEKDETR